jgi:hypothetical protein
MSVASASAPQPPSPPSLSPVTCGQNLPWDGRLARFPHSPAMLRGSNGRSASYGAGLPRTLRMRGREICQRFAGSGLRDLTRGKASSQADCVEGKRVLGSPWHASQQSRPPPAIAPHDAPGPKPLKTPAFDPKGCECPRGRTHGGGSNRHHRRRGGCAAPPLLWWPCSTGGASAWKGLMYGAPSNQQPAHFL